LAEVFMSSLLVYVTCGTKNPTKAALAFFVAAAAVEAGNQVHVFLAVDAVQLMREPTCTSLVGLGRDGFVRCT
jgi:predicted peroxiredoxin